MKDPKGSFACTKKTSFGGVQGHTTLHAMKARIFVKLLAGQTELPALQKFHALQRFPKSSVSFHRCLVSQKSLLCTFHNWLASRSFWSSHKLCTQSNTALTSIWSCPQAPERIQVSRRLLYSSCLFSKFKLLSLPWTSMGFTKPFNLWDHAWSRLTLALILFQSSTSFSVHLSTIVVVCKGDGSFAKYGP